MLKIRLARWGKKKAPFYRVVLTEHTKPAQSWYMLVLWRFDPLKHESKMDIEKIKAWIAKWAQPTNRVAKLALKESWDEMFRKYIVETKRVRTQRNAPVEAA